MDGLILPALMMLENFQDEAAEYWRQVKREFNTQTDNYKVLFSWQPEQELVFTFLAWFFCVVFRCQAQSRAQSKRSIGERKETNNRGDPFKCSKLLDFSPGQTE